VLGVVVWRQGPKRGKGFRSVGRRTLEGAAAMTSRLRSHNTQTDFCNVSKVSSVSVGSCRESVERYLRFSRYYFLPPAVMGKCARCANQTTLISFPFKSIPPQRIPASALLILAPTTADCTRATTKVRLLVCGW
jgi:hypothetical protein